MILILRLIDLLQLLLIVAALATWISPDHTNTFLRLLFGITEPILRPLRKVTPLLGGMDITPVVAILLLEILSWGLVRLVS